MKNYVSPEMIEVEVNASELIATSPDPDEIKLGACAPDKATDAVDPSAFAADSYRSTLWND